ncbi:PH domain-containing protein [Paraburkholderia sp. BR13439]|uniref:PH domain-containing protein n=1 Tax=unclassified Paraburkholderia TaxID=2615204 RepID=UPI0034CFFE04
MSASAQPTVIFHGAPSHVINMPDLFGTSVAIGGLAVVFSWVVPRWPVSPAVVIAFFLLCLARLALVFVETAPTEIVNDMERITCRQGILTRKVSSLELFRIQDVISLHPWWQRVFNVGTVVILTSDSSNPRCCLPGMVNAEQMRNALNRAARLQRYSGSEYGAGLTRGEHHA